MSKNNKLNRSIWILAIAIASGILVFYKFHGTSSSDKAKLPEKTALAVEGLQPKMQEWPVRLVMNGSISSWQEAQVSAEIGGLRIKEVLVDVGSEVKRGQDLVLLADETVLADLHKQEATVARDEASLAEAKSNADRARDIKESGALSTQQINQYLIAEETAKANLALSQAELENQRIRLRQTHVTAADDGIISSRTANLGNVVAAGSELFRLIRQGRIEWRGEVNSQQLAMIRKGQKVELVLPDNRHISGVVRITAPTVDANTRNSLVYVDLDKHAAQPGMYAQGSIEIGSKQALSVPQSALVLRDGRSYLYELDLSSNTHGNQVFRVIQRSVTTGRRLGDLVEIVEGIRAESTFVASGGAFLNDGDWVTLVSSDGGAR